MNAKETVKLTRLVAAACPQQAIDDYTPDAWFDLLGDLDFADCYQAMIAVAQRQPFVAPAEIRAEVRKIREDRLARTPLPAPPAELADDPGRYQQAIQASVKRLADGNWSARKALGPGQRRQTDPPPVWQEAKAALMPEPVKARDPREVAREQAEEARRARAESDGAS